MAIVGVGLIGGSLGLALRERGAARRVVAIDRDAETRRIALARGAADAATDDLAGGIAGAELVVLATPVGVTLGLLPRVAAELAARPNVIVTDVGSVKGAVARAGASAFPQGGFVAGHPMAGSERSGVAAAAPDLFAGATWALTPTETTSPGDVARVAGLARAVGALPLLLDPEAHDAAVAVTSHLPHVLAYALGAVADEAARANPRLFDLAAGSFASATRVAASPPEMWQGIASQNRAALARALRAYVAELEAVRVALESGDDGALGARFAAGHDAALRARAARSPAD
ncbi:MAG TPA: prephenate dehydrogenase/arogenate dehydrogenase family protein [Armatimonadaceae bacterium]|nr:prephenate dehydrogenase/arogenate dehydrogenase family protein [Armatimonadaceae bacterium]